MGAVLGYELARQRREEGQPETMRCKGSGCHASQLSDTRDVTYDLPDAEFLDELRRLKGTPMARQGTPTARLGDVGS